MPNPSIIERVRRALQIEDPAERLEVLRALRDQAPAEASDELVALLGSPEQKVRRRAGSGLSFFKLGGVSLERRAEEVAEHLLNNPDERVRLSCAIVLMSVPGPAVDRAFVSAVRDSSEKIAQIACLEVGDRLGAGGSVVLDATLGHSSWRVRLEACKALITQKTVDQRVVATLEAMSREPEASHYDAEVASSKEMLAVFAKAFSPDGSAAENWDKLETILAKARALVRRG